MSDDLDADMQSSIRNMHAAKIVYEAACQNYLAACMARNWKLADDLREQVNVASDAALDAVAVVYRRLEIAEQIGR